MFKAAFATGALISATAGLTLQTSTTCSDLASVNQLDCDIHDAQNKLRTNPSYYLAFLDDRIAAFNSDGTRYWTGSYWMRTQEGVSAVREARDAVAAQQPIAALAWSDTDYMASKVHCDDMGPQGKFSHTGSDGSSPSERIYRYTDQRGRTGENLAAGNSAAEEIVMQLYIDDGVPSRGHRTNMMSTGFTYEGTATCDHASYGTMSAFNFSSFIGTRNTVGKAKYTELNGGESGNTGSGSGSGSDSNDNSGSSDDSSNNNNANNEPEEEEEEEGPPAGFTTCRRTKTHAVKLMYNGRCSEYTVSFSKSGAWGETCWDFNNYSWISTCDDRYPDQKVCLKF